MAHAEIDPYATDADEAVCVTTSWNEKPLIEQVPGAHWDARAQTWRAPLTYAAAVTLRGVFGPRFTYGPALTDWLWNERRTRVDPALFLRDKTEWPAEWPRTSMPEFVPGLKPFQEVGATWLLVAVDDVLGDDMGTGKTVQILSALHVLARAGRGLPALVICPNGVKRHWARLAERWCPGATPYVVAGTATQRDRVLRAARLDSTALVIINIEAARLFSRLAPYGSVKLKRCRSCSPHGEPNLSASRCEVHPKALNGFGFRVAVLDEAHHVQNPRSKWTRAVWSIMHDPSITHHWGATGTIIGDHPGNAWSIMHAVARREFPVKSKWMDRYALMSWNSGGGTEVVGLRPDTRDEFFSYFDARFRRMTQELVLPQLPPLVRLPRLVDMTTAQARMYRELDDRLQTRDEHGELLLVADQLVEQTRLMQLAAATCDVVKGDADDVATWTIKMREPCPKLDELEKVIDELGNDPFVVAAEHRDLIDLASARLVKRGIRHGFVTGGQSEFERDQQLQLLREGKIRCILFTIKAGSEGVDMSAAPTLIALQRSWRMIHDLQMIKRVKRIGSEHHRMIRVIDIVSEGTIEVPQVARIAQKAARLEEINRDRETLRRAGLDTTTLDIEAQAIVNSHLGVPNEREVA